MSETVVYKVNTGFSSVLRRSCTVAKFSSRKNITVWFLTWEKSAALMELSPRQYGYLSFNLQPNMVNLNPIRSRRLSGTVSAIHNLSVLDSAPLIAEQTVYMDCRCKLYYLKKKKKQWQPTKCINCLVNSAMDILSPEIDMQQTKTYIPTVYKSPMVSPLHWFNQWLLWFNTPQWYISILYDCQESHRVYSIDDTIICYKNSTRRTV